MDETFQDDWYAVDDERMIGIYDDEIDEIEDDYSHRRNNKGSSVHHSDLSVDLCYSRDYLPPFLTSSLTNQSKHKTIVNTGDPEESAAEIVDAVTSVTHQREEDIIVPVKDYDSIFWKAAEAGSKVLKEYRKESAVKRANKEEMDASKSTAAILLRQRELRTAGTDNKDTLMTQSEKEALEHQIWVEKYANANVAERREMDRQQREKEEQRMRYQKTGGHNNLQQGKVGDSFDGEAMMKRLQLLQDRRALPIYKCRKELMRCISENPVSIILGETGSGKTTQLVQYMLEDGYTKPVVSTVGNSSSTGPSLIGCTQPRKVAAIGVARRVAEEVGCPCGDKVGYAVRLEDRTSSATQVKFMTDGVILREIMNDKLLSKYSAVVVDEAHERSVNTDVLLGVLKNILKHRRDFRLIVTSATMDAKKFADYFGGAPIFHIPGRVFDVDVVYETAPVEDYIDETVAKIVEIHARNPIRFEPKEETKRPGKDMGNGRNLVSSLQEEENVGEKRQRSEELSNDYYGSKKGVGSFSTIVDDDVTGNAVTLDPLSHSTHSDEDEEEKKVQGTGADILVFLPGKEEILAVIALVKETLETYNFTKERKESLLLVPLYSELSSSDQMIALAPSPEGKRKCVVATNVAETSLTIDGVRFVIDAGFMKTNVFRPKIGMDTLQLYPISRAEANQRKGRAGRTAEGMCFRLYTEHQYEHEMLPSIIPEIQRSSIDSVVLLLKSIGETDISKFDFIDPPPIAAIRHSLYKLWLLGGLSSDTGDITEVGRRMLDFPVNPTMAKILIASLLYDCTEEMLCIAAMMSVDSRSLFMSPLGKEEEAKQARGQFNVLESDHLTLLNVYVHFWRSNCSRHWAQANFLEYRTLRRAVDIRVQFSDKMNFTKRLHYMKLNQHPPRLGDLGAINIDAVSEKVRRCLVHGYITHVAKRIKYNEYQSIATGVSCQLNPLSSIRAAPVSPEYVIYHEFLFTSKEYLCIVTAVDPMWALEASRGVISGIAQGGKEIVVSESTEEGACAGFSTVKDIVVSTRNVQPQLINSKYPLSTAELLKQTLIHAVVASNDKDNISHGTQSSGVHSAITNSTSTTERRTSSEITSFGLSSVSSNSSRCKPVSVIERRAQLAKKKKNTL